MIGLNYGIYIHKLDKAKLLNAVRNSVREVLLSAGRKFLLAAIPRIPIRTGFARSAFRNAEDLFGKVSVDAQSGGYRIRGTRGGGNQDRILRYREYYYPPSGGRVLKTTNAGRAFSTGSEDILIIGSTLASGRTAYYLKFSVDITYVDLLDRSVWGAFAAGEEAVNAYIRQELDKQLPDAAKFFTRSQLR